MNKLLLTDEFGLRCVCFQPDMVGSARSDQKKKRENFKGVPARRESRGAARTVGVNIANAADIQLARSDARMNNETKKKKR